MPYKYHQAITMLTIIALLNSCVLYSQRDVTDEEYKKCMVQKEIIFEMNRVAGNKYVLNPNNVKKPLLEKCNKVDGQFFHTEECKKYRKDAKEYKERHHEQCQSTSFRDEHYGWFAPWEALAIGLASPVIIAGVVLFIPFCLVTQCWQY